MHGGVGGETVAPGVLAVTGNNALVDRALVELRTAPDGPAVPVVHGLLQRDGHVVDVNRDGMVKYVGANNDRDPILQNIGGTVPTATLSGQYRSEDLNLDGVVKYSCAGNDREIVLQTSGGVVPTAVRIQQIP